MMVLRQAKWPMLLSLAIIGILLTDLISSHALPIAHTLASSPSQPDNDWPTTGYNLAQTRFTSDESLAPDQLHRLKPVWTFPDKGGRIVASPVVADGIVYVVYKGAYAITSLYALEYRTGQPRPHITWSFSPSNPSDSFEYAPTIAGKIIYIASSFGTLCALDLTTGTLLWTMRSGDAVSASLTVTEHTVYLTTLHRLYAVDTTTHTRRVVFSTPGLLDATPAIAGNTLYLSSFQYSTQTSSLHALDVTRHTDPERWVFPAQGVIAQGVSPVVVGDTVYLATQERCYAIYAASGRPKWMFPDARSMREVDFTVPPAVAYEKVFIPSGDYLYALYQGSGQMAWAYAMPGIIRDPAIVAYGTVYIGSPISLMGLDAVTHVLSAHSKPRWDYSFSPSVGSFSHAFPAVISRGWLYAVDEESGDSEDQTLLAFHLEDPRDPCHRSIT